MKNINIYVNLLATHIIIYILVFSLFYNHINRVMFFFWKYTYAASKSGRYDLIYKIVMKDLFTYEKLENLLLFYFNFNKVQIIHRIFDEKLVNSESLQYET